MRFGLDVSEHQDGLPLAKAEGVEFVIIRTTDGTYHDRVFSSHFADATQAGLAIEAYHFLRSPREGTTVDEQVAASLEVLAGARVPMWLDCETPAGLSLDDVRRAHHLFTQEGVPVAGIYTSRSWWLRHTWGADTRPFGTLWLAFYGADSGTYPGNDAWPKSVGRQEPVMWQYTSRGRVTGYSGDVDLDARR
ncbi:Lysozyme M1 precursor [Corynebacterium capitovis DSM 44611]|uniref:glycoside hydrolase family 25 protein n=1 Tax=Corynebacterium capitovis TaxID=131081 RepID=UPI00036CFC58|nr:glycoside hydrolase family 25 protein [Corynebacterium capitovis]WKD57309.1 Lysozyme M1 precursor [Corynebacterium capitovis DSM 44611]